MCHSQQEFQPLTYSVWTPQLEPWVSLRLRDTPKAWRRHVVRQRLQRIEEERRCLSETSDDDGKTWEMLDGLVPRPVWWVSRQAVHTPSPNSCLPVPNSPSSAPNQFATSKECYTPVCNIKRMLQHSNTSLKSSLSPRAVPQVSQTFWDFWCSNLLWLKVSPCQMSLGNETPVSQ